MPSTWVIHGGNASAPSWIVTGEETIWKPGDSLDRLDSIVKQEHARRAAEVAIVGGHRILFVGVGNMYDAERLAAWVVEVGPLALDLGPEGGDKEPVRSSD
jgi:hypothetical protein